jgi:hypothetical protein
MNLQTIHLHAGGATTGVEDLVVWLAANRAGLRRAGYGLYCFDVLGTGEDSFARMLPADLASVAECGQAATRQAARFAPDRKAGSEGFIVAAPDLAGPVGELMLGRFHVQARARARLMRAALGQGVDRLVLAVQPYEVLFHSAWMAMALDRRMEPFSDYADALSRFEGGWADLATALCEELEVRELVVQVAPTAAQQTLGQLVPGLTLRQPVEPLPKPRVTQSAVAMVQRLLAQGTRLQPGQRDRLIAFHARQPQNGPDHGFSPGVLADLRGRYVADLDMLTRSLGARVAGVPVAVIAAE